MTYILPKDEMQLEAEVVDSEGYEPRQPYILPKGEMQLEAEVVDSDNEKENR